MNVFINGAGITGCTLARLLKDSGHSVSIYEKSSTIGGLCKTVSKEGILCDRYGPHLLRSSSDKVFDFINNSFKLNNKPHYVGSYINGRIFDWPISRDNIAYLGSIFGDAVMHWEDVCDNPTTFEHVSLNTFGPVLYRLFVENYTRNMWHCDPSTLDASVAARVLKINDNDKRYFKTKYQGWPKGGYSAALSGMTTDISICYQGSVRAVLHPDTIVVDTGPIDSLFRYKYGELDYVGMEFELEVVDKLDPVELYRYPVINYPNCEFGYIRQTAYRGITGQLADKEVVGYEYPSKSAKTHPVKNKENRERLFKYLEFAAAGYGVIPAGRLGLHKYISMDEAILMAMDISIKIDAWSEMSCNERLDNLCGWAGLDINEYCTI